MVKHPSQWGALFCAAGYTNSGTMSTQPTPYLTPQQYLEIERAAEFRSEYFNGAMYSMSGGSWRHDRIVGDVFGALRAQLRGRKCSVASSSFRLQVAAEGVYLYPDITVFCGPPKFAGA